jgi:ubiquinone/menaquinone biosynthesis C-methylase UbiE
MVFKAIYRKQQEKRAQNIAHLLEQIIKKGDNVLDLGMGDGLIAKQLQLNHDINILGLDVEDYNTTDIPLVINNSNTLPFADSQFDVVLVISVLHHTNDFIHLLAESKRICKRRIVILEDVYSNIIEKAAIIFTDSISNLLSPISMPFNFRKEQEWLSIFSILGLKIVYQQQQKIPWFDWFKRILFVLTP